MAAPIGSDPAGEKTSHTRSPDQPGQRTQVPGVVAVVDVVAIPQPRRAHLLAVGSWAQPGLSGADLRGADLRGADLSGANLSMIEYDDHTVWPDGFAPPSRR